MGTGTLGAGEHSCPRNHRHSKVTPAVSDTFPYSNFQGQPLDQQHQCHWRRGRNANDRAPRQTQNRNSRNGAQQLTGTLKLKTSAPQKPPNLSNQSPHTQITAGTFLFCSFFHRPASCRHLSESYPPSKHRSNPSFIIKPSLITLTNVFLSSVELQKNSFSVPLPQYSLIRQNKKMAMLQSSTPGISFNVPILSRVATARNHVLRKILRLH